MSLAIAVVIFVGLYLLLRARAGRQSGSTPPVQWGWLAAVVGCAAIALAAGLIL